MIVPIDIKIQDAQICGEGVAVNNLSFSSIKAKLTVQKFLINVG